ARRRGRVRDAARPGGGDRAGVLLHRRGLLRPAGRALRAVRRGVGKRLLGSALARGGGGGVDTRALPVHTGERRLLPGAARADARAGAPLRPDHQPQGVVLARRGLRRALRARPRRGGLAALRRGVWRSAKVGVPRSGTLPARPAERDAYFTAPPSRACR